jgi:hypothetical protein
MAFCRRERGRNRSRAGRAGRAIEDDDVTAPEDVLHNARHFDSGEKSRANIAWIFLRASTGFWLV